MERDQSSQNPSNTSNPSRGSDVPGTSKDPKGQTIRDQPSKDKNRQGQGQGSKQGGTGYGDDDSDAQDGE